ncbi:hypothetical protein ACWDNT_24480, partial [Streptomyces sp. NPDC000963]
MMDVPVYEQPHHRAAALLEQLVRVPALEHSNELYGVVVAAANEEALVAAIEAPVGRGEPILQVRAMIATRSPNRT